jgi:hypothetical protein
VFFANVAKMWLTGFLGGTAWTFMVPDAAIIFRFLKRCASPVVGPLEISCH